MTTSADLERALAAAGLAAPVRWEEVTGSTNATAARLALDGAPEWTLVGAGHQTAGRGRLGRTWEDRPGRALLVSLVLRPAIRPSEAGLLPLLAGAALAEAALEVAGVEARCKWPNDLLVGEVKAGGILMESRAAGEDLAFAILGMGVNLEPPDHLEDVIGLGDLDPMALLGAFLRRFRDGYRPGDAGFAAAVVARWTAVAATPGRDVRVTVADGSFVEGRSAGVDARGALIVETSEGPRTYTSGEVVHLR